MALEVLKGVEEIGGFKIVRVKPPEMSWDDFDKTRDEFPINITERMNTISFRIQNGPVKEVGVNGCQIVTLIEAARVLIEKHNEKFPSMHNISAMHHLELAIFSQERRAQSRGSQGVEGTSQV